jgi:hypothetical protein
MPRKGGTAELESTLSLNGALTRECPSSSSETAKKLLTLPSSITIQQQLIAFSTFNSWQLKIN